MDKMSHLNLSLLLVKSNVDIMVVATPFCHTCFEKKRVIQFTENFQLLVKNINNY